jgi:hypothetical protein
VPKLYQAGKIPINGFTMYIGPTSKQSRIWIGTFLMPSPDQSALIWYPLTSVYHWQVGMSQVTCGTTSVSLTASKHVVFDSGTSLTYIPSQEYNQIFSIISAGRNCQPINSMQVCNCNGVSDSSYPTIYVYLKNLQGTNTPIAITPSLYLWRYTNS